MDWNRELEDQKAQEQIRKEMDERLTQAEQQKALRLLHLVGVEQMLLQIRDQVWLAGKVVPVLPENSSNGAIVLFLSYIDGFYLKESEKSLSVVAIPHRERRFIGLSVRKNTRDLSDTPVRFQSIPAAQEWLKKQLLADCRWRRSLPDFPYPLLIQKNHDEIRNKLKEGRIVKDQVEWFKRKMKELEREFLEYR